MVLAQEESRLLDHNYIGTEHLLLGLLREGEGVAAKALSELGVDLERARAAVKERVGAGSGRPDGHIPFTPRAKQSMEMSLREALKLGHNYIGTEHLLLGLLAVPDGTACQLMEGFGLRVQGVRATIIDVMSGYRMVQTRQEPAQPAEGIGPNCPGCFTPLQDRVRARPLAVTTGEHVLGPDAVLALYCEACGRLLGVLPG